MTRVIYKYPYSEDLKVPKGFQWTHIGLQGDKIYIWLEVDPNEKELVSLNLIKRGTGWEWEEDENDYSIQSLHYVQTIMQGPFVWHFYWDTKDV